MAKIIVLMGAPGAGKGTQARLVSKQFGWPRISTGDILREMAHADTPLGRQVKDILASGQLVSDEILAEIIRERTSRPDCQDGYILDGFPRTIRQAELLDQLVAGSGHELLVMNFTVDRQALIERLSQRRTCPQCEAVYHLRYQPPRRDEICDRCGTPLEMRSDDTPEASSHRLDVHGEKTAPVIEYYRQRGKVVDINGGRPIHDVSRDVFRAIEGANGE